MGAKIERALANVIRAEVKNPATSDSERTTRAAAKVADYLSGKSIAKDELESVVRKAVGRAHVEFSVGEAILEAVLGRAPAAVKANADKGLRDLLERTREQAMSRQAVREAIADFQRAAPKLVQVVADARGIAAESAAAHAAAVAAAQAAAEAAAKTAAQASPPPEPALPPEAAKGLMRLVQAVGARLARSPAAASEPTPQPVSAAKVPPPPTPQVSGDAMMQLKRELFDRADPLGKVLIKLLAEEAMATVAKMVEFGPAAQTALDAMAAEVAALPPTFRDAGMYLCSFLGGFPAAQRHGLLDRLYSNAKGGGVAAELVERVAKRVASGGTSHDDHRELIQLLNALEPGDHARMRSGIRALFFKEGSDATIAPISEQLRQSLYRALEPRPAPANLEEVSLAKLNAITENTMTPPREVLKQLRSFVSSEAITPKVLLSVLAAVPRGVAWGFGDTTKEATEFVNRIAATGGGRWSPAFVEQDVYIASHGLARSAKTDDLRLVEQIGATVRELLSGSGHLSGKRESYRIDVEHMLQALVAALYAPR